MLYNYQFVTMVALLIQEYTRIFSLSIYLFDIYYIACHYVLESLPARARVLLFV